MVISTGSVIGTSALGVALLLFVVMYFRTEQRTWFSRFFALGAGFVIGALVLFVLPSVYQLSGNGKYFIVLGALIVPVLHLLLVERQPDSKRVRHPLSGILSWVRVAVFTIIYGDALALIDPNPFDMTLFVVISLFALAPEFLAVYTLLHYEGSRKMRAALLTGILAFLPLVAVLAVGTLILVVLPNVAAPFVGIAAGTMLYLAIADRISEALRRQSWGEIGLALVGAVIAAIIVVIP